MNILLWIYYISMTIIVTFAFANKEARGVRVGNVTISAFLSTLLIAVIPIANTIFVIGYIYAKWTTRELTRWMTKKY
jgi:hypothetical protein